MTNLTDSSPDPTTDSLIVVRGPGRPRRFDDGVEEELILNAALKIMRVNGDADASVADILREAEVSSRAFYRHFPSKDHLLLALFRRDSALTSAQIEAAADAAPTPTDAIYAWLDGYLAIFFDPRRAARVEVMNSESARRAEGYSDALLDAQQKLALPLARALRQGNESGELTSPDPEFDAYAIFSLCSAASGASQLSKKTSDREEARRLILRFISPAIGLATR